MIGRHWVFKTITALALVAILAGGALAHGDRRPEKTGILLVAFGTTDPDAQKAFHRIDDAVQKAFPGVEVRWAYTSKMVRDKLAGQGQLLDSPAAALAQMADDGFTRVAVQSLHTIPGEEYHYLVETAHALAGLPKGIRTVLVGYPLLATHEDLEAAADAIMATMPAERKPEEAVVLMGHGTHHPGNAFYPAMRYVLSREDPAVFVGTVEGAPSIDEVLADLEAGGYEKVWLRPFMSVAGDHAKNDMAGDEPDSWKSTLTEAGYDVEVVLKGTAEYPAFVDLWVNHLQGAMSHFE